MPKREKEDCDHCYYSTGDPDGKGVCADGFSLALFFPLNCSLWIFWVAGGAGFKVMVIRDPSWFVYCGNQAS
jgi:hypothetical protein